jgi:hypothetical protein
LILLMAALFDHLSPNIENIQCTQMELHDMMKHLMS